MICTSALCAVSPSWHGECSQYVESALIACRRALRLDGEIAPLSVAIAASPSPAEV
jgi:hypothetical protein